MQRYEEVDSTNRLAADAARQGATDGLVVVADHQTAGRGRHGRRWEAPAGSSLLVSVVVTLPSTTPPHLGTVAMAVAAADACAQVAGIEPLLKWPNDLVVGERKLGGILGEAVDGTGTVVVGIGLNVNWGTTQPPPPGVSLDELTGGPVDRDELLHALLVQLERRLEEGPEKLVATFEARSATLGRRVRVELEQETIEGRAAGITPDGHLLVVDATGTGREVSAGDVVHLHAGSGEAVR